MSLSTAFAALAWEYFQAERPMQPRHTASRGMVWLHEYFNAGQEQHGLLAWLTGVLLPGLLIGGLSLLLAALWWPLSWAFDVVVLYFCLGFRQATEFAQRLAQALQAGDLTQARGVLSEWRPGTLIAATAEGMARQGVEELLRQSLLRLFGILFWFLVLGPAGAVIYLLNRLARERWHMEPDFGAPSRRITYWLDWLPARAVAFSFAIAGNFEDAMEAWRGQAWAWGEPNEGILLAAGAGALGLRLGGNLPLAEGELSRPELGMGEVPEPDAVEAVATLVWRAAFLWLAVFALLWLGSL